jgi:uncharacterized protein YmfQ (DUF2313 family)
MATVNGLIEDWIQIRAVLQRQLKTLETGEAQAAVSDNVRNATVLRIRCCISELNSLLKEYANAQQR